MTLSSLKSSEDSLCCNDLETHDFRENLTAEVALFHACEHVICDLEASIFSSRLSIPLQCNEKSLVEAHNLNSFRPTSLPLISDIRPIRQFSSCGDLCSDGSLREINCQRLFKSLDCICDGCGTSERGDVEDDFENESPDPCQTALIAGGLVRVLARDFFDHNATPPLRLQRLRVRLASMSDTDWVAALSEVTCQYHRRTGDHLNLSSSYFDMTTSLSSQRQTHGVKSDPLLPTTVSPSPYRLLPSTNSGQRQLPVGVENFFRSASTEWRSENDYGVGRLTSKRLIISPIIPKEKRKGILLSQENHCFGCGVYVETKYLRSLRFCEYFGRFFCCVCHANTLMVVPGALLHSW
uniref:DUF4206 domain-containing protein n=1 Tax=Mesocestoides corti TaxID=53468 RepID=A0A5K3EYV9_MESCO